MAQFRKAYTAFGVALAGSVGLACADGNVTGAEMVVAAGVALVALAAVYRVPNEEAPGA